MLIFDITYKLISFLAENQVFVTVVFRCQKNQKFFRLKNGNRKPKVT